MKIIAVLCITLAHLLVYPGAPELLAHDRISLLSYWVGTLHVQGMMTLNLCFLSYISLKLKIKVKV